MSERDASRLAELRERLGDCWISCGTYENPIVQCRWCAALREGEDGRAEPHRNDCPRTILADVMDKS